MDLEGKTGLISDLEKEMKVEKQSNVNENKCEHCEKVITRKRAMRRHVKRVHLNINGEIKIEKQSNRNDNKCEHCGKVLTRKRAMKLHIRRVHLKIKDVKVEKQSNEKVIKCEHEQCDKMLPRKFMKLHIKRVHLKIRDHVCEVCKKPFTTISDLKTHGIVHEERKFPCNICGLKIRSKESLVNHIEGRHMGISKKPYFCQDCGIHYSNTSHRRMHIDQSKLEKYTCETCGKQFGFRKNLKKHEKTQHTAGREKNYVIYSNDFKLDVLKKSEEIGIDQIAKLVGIKDPKTIERWGNDEGRMRSVVHHTLQKKKEVVAYALANSVSEAEKKYNIEDSTIRWWIKKLEKCDAMDDLNFALRKDYVQKTYSAQVSNFP